MLFFFWFEFENDVILQRDKYLDITIYKRKCTIVF